MPITSHQILRRLPLAALLVLAACAGQPMPAAPPNPAPVTFTTPDGTRIHIVQTGWVAVKERFRELSGPGWLRIPSIVLNRKWTEWLPIQFYVLEHAEGILVFDTGETAAVIDPEYFACDGGTRWFYTNQLRFAVTAKDELGSQLRLLDIDPAQVRWAVLSHLHSDHMGGMKHLRNSEFLISAEDWRGHRGALMCRIPEWVEPSLVTFAGDPFGAFQQSRRITADGSARIVPTPGHTPGHQSVLFKEAGVYYFFAGDVVFDLARVEDGTALAGIVEQLEPARASISAVERQLRDHPTVLLPAHDRGARDVGDRTLSRGRSSHTHTH